MLQGKQVGTLMNDGDNGIRVILDPIASIIYKRIVNGAEEPMERFAIYQDIYDTRQGAMVGGIALCDAQGFPIPNEHYRISDFTWTGNLSNGGGIEPISFI